VKSTAFFLLVFCACLHGQSGGFYFTADALANDCRVSVRIRDNPESPSPRAIQDLKDAQMCIGYITGVVDTYEVERKTKSMK
jgi:hypothetical protein